MMIELLLRYYSSGSQGAVVAALVPGVNVVKVLLIGLGIMKDEATVKSMTRFGDHRSLELFNILYIYRARFRENRKKLKT